MLLTHYCREAEGPSGLEEREDGGSRFPGADGATWRGCGKRLRGHVCCPSPLLGLSVSVTPSPFLSGSISRPLPPSPTRCAVKISVSGRCWAKLWLQSEETPGCAVSPVNRGEGSRLPAAFGPSPRPIPSPFHPFSLSGDGVEDGEGQERGHSSARSDDRAT